MITHARRLGGAAAVLLSCWLALSGSALAQSRTAAVAVTRDQIEPCLAFDPTGALAQCADAGDGFDGAGLAAVPAGGVPRLALSAAVLLGGTAESPLSQSVGAQAMLQDLVTLAGAGATARVTFSFRVTGTLVQQSPPDATATLQVDVQGQGRVWSADQSIDEPIEVTIDLAPGGLQELNVFASARASMTRTGPQAAGGAASVGVPAAAAIELVGVRIVDQAGAPMPGASLTSELGYTYPILADPPTGLVAVGPATLWIGLERGDGVPVDVRAEFYVNAALVASGELRCLRDLEHRRGRAQEARVALGAPAEADLAPGDVLALRILARVGTNADGTPCASPRSHGRLESDGVRLLFDSTRHPSRLALEVAGESPRELYLRADDHACSGLPGFGRGLGHGQPFRHHGHGHDLVLDVDPPDDRRGKARDSGELELAGGNPWGEIGTWTTTLD